MRRQPKINTFTCFLLSKPSTPKLPFFETSNPLFLISNSVFSSQPPVFLISKLSFSHHNHHFSPFSFLISHFIVFPISHFSFVISHFSRLSHFSLLICHFSFLPSFPFLTSHLSFLILSQTLFSYYNRFKPVFKNACILVLGIRK